MVFPYLKGFDIIKCNLFYIVLWIYCVFKICGDYICKYTLELNNWYQSTFLGQIREESLVVNSGSTMVWVMDSSLFDG